MRRFWCACGTTVEADVEWKGDAYEAEFFDSADRAPVDDCPGCGIRLYPALCKGTLKDSPPRRPSPQVRSAA